MTNPQFYERVWETNSGTFTSGSPIALRNTPQPAYRGFSVATSGTTVPYTITDGVTFECGQAVYTSGTLTRTSLGASTNSGAFVGAVEIFLPFPSSVANTIGVINSGAVQSGMIGNAAVVSGSIASGQIGTIHLASGVLASPVIQSGTIVSGMIGNNAVTSGNIASGQIGVYQLASGVLASPVIQSGTIVSGMIGNAAVVSGSIASGQIGTMHLASGVLEGGITSGSVVGQFAGGWDVASGSIGNNDIGQNAIQPGNIASGTLQTWNCSPGQFAAPNTLYVSPLSTSIVGPMANNPAPQTTQISLYAAETISGNQFIAVSMSGTAVVAMASCSGRNAAVGLCGVNQTANNEVSCVLIGSWRYASGAINYSGFLGQPCFLPRSGGYAVPASGLLNSGGFQSGDTIQRVGTILDASGGILLNMGEPFAFRASGL